MPHCPKTAAPPGGTAKTGYVAWSGEVARSQNAAFIDLNQIILSHYVGLTPEEIKTKYFTPADDTHTSPAGAELNAACVVEGIKGLKNCPLAALLVAAPANK